MDGVSYFSSIQIELSILSGLSVALTKLIAKMLASLVRRSLN